MSDTLHIIAVTRKPQAASFEHRVLDYVQPLRRRGIELDVRTLPKGIFAQRRFIADLHGADAIFWQRHLLSPLLHGALRRVNRPIVFDFDDPLTFSSAGGYRPSATRRRRFAKMLRRCAAATPASEYLAELARPYVDDVRIVPMAVACPPQVEPRDESPVQLLWLGSKATQPYLDEIRAALDEIGRGRSSVSLRLVAHEPMDFGALKVDFRPWSPQQQDLALRECHIGLCPMPHTPWTRGKCPYKVLQYMSYAMAWVGSAVGENIVAGGSVDEASARGLCAADQTQWVDAMTKFIDDAAWRTAAGQRGRTYVQQNHGIEPLADRLAKLFRHVTAE